MTNKDIMEQAMEETKKECERIFEDRGYIYADEVQDILYTKLFSLEVGSVNR